MPYKTNVQFNIAFETIEKFPLNIFSIALIYHAHQAHRMRWSHIQATRDYYFNLSIKFIFLSLFLSQRQNQNRFPYSEQYSTTKFETIFFLLFLLFSFYFVCIKCLLCVCWDFSIVITWKLNNKVCILPLTM